MRKLISAVLVFLLLAVGSYSVWILTQEQDNNLSPETAVIQEFIIKGLSMEPEFKHGQIVEVDKNAYIQSSPKAGDIIAFQFEHLNDPLIKRIAGAPGDTINIEDGWLWINQEKKIPFGRMNTAVWKQGESYTIKQDKYFVLSDNDSIGEDSRIWGLVSKKDIIGKVLTK
jgi:signal peptidase I